MSVTAHYGSVQCLTCLSDDDQVCPLALDAGGVERALADGHTRVCHGLAEHAAHARAGFDSTQLLYGGRPVRVGKQRASEDACAGTDPEREAETHRERTERGRYGCTPTLLH